MTPCSGMKRCPITTEASRFAQFQSASIRIPVNDLQALCVACSRYSADCTSCDNWKRLPSLAIGLWKFAYRVYAVIHRIIVAVASLPILHCRTDSFINKLVYTYCRTFFMGIGFVFFSFFLFVLCYVWLYIIALRSVVYQCCPVWQLVGSVVAFWLQL